MYVIERSEKINHYWCCGSCINYRCSFFIFSRGKSADDYVKEYYGYLENKEYGKMYNMLTKGSLAKTSQKYLRLDIKIFMRGLKLKILKLKLARLKMGLLIIL